MSTPSAQQPRRSSRAASSARRFLVAGAFAATLLLAACGGGSGDDSVATTQPDVAPSIETTSPGDDTTTTSSTIGGGLAADAPTRSIDLAGDRVFPEGVAYDASTGSFYVSSSGDGTIFRGDLASGTTEEFLAAGGDGRTSALGMAVDSERGRLWVAGGLSQMVFAYDLDSGELLAARELTPVPTGSILNDLTVTDDGDVFITNSGAPIVYRVAGGGDEIGELEVWLDYTGTVIPSEGAILLNGIVATPSGFLLAVHTSTQQLFRLDPDTMEILEVDTGGEGVGADGLALDGTTLYGVTPLNVVRTDLADDFTSGTVVGTITDDTFMFATTVAVIPDDRMLVVNSQFNARDTPQLPFTISDLSKLRR